MNCGVYVDPETGDIYNVNGDTMDWLTVWTREQKGNMPASRELSRAAPRFWRDRGRRSKGDVSSRFNIQPQS